MRFILTLFKKILSALSNIYTKAEVDTVLEPKLEVEELEEAVLGETGAMYEAYDGHIDSADEWKARSKALANIAKWRSYASAMQSMVDDEMATMIAEEFEKAAQKYLENPEATEEWVTTQDEDGNISSTCPYYEIAPTRPVIDFNVTVLYGVYNLAPVFNTETNVPIFLPNVARSQYSLLLASSFNSPVILPNAVDVYMSLRGTSFNFPISLPKATQCGHLLSLAKKFNSRIYAPVATNFGYSLQGAGSFNQPLDLPEVITCGYMLSGATVFNSSLNLPNVKECSYMLYDAKSFNQPLSLPKATNCSYMLQDATSFNQPLSLPNATNCSNMLTGATAFNSTLDLPKATNCILLLHKASSFNQPLSLPNATNCLSLLYLATSFNSPLDIPNATNCGNLCQQATSFNQPVYLPKCKTAANAFIVTSMNAANIAATLDSLPHWTDGASHVITFTRSPGASELTQDSPSVAAAVAKGWTVQL